MPTQLIATCPYRNKFAVSAPVDAPNRPFRVIGQQPGGYAALLALPRVLLTVKHGAASRVHECLTQVLGLASNLEGLDVEGGGEKDPVSCVVVFASGQQLIFEEEREREGGDDQNEGSAAAERGGSDGGGREEQPPSPTKQPSTHRPPPSGRPRRLPDHALRLLPGRPSAPPSAARVSMASLHLTNAMTVLRLLSQRRDMVNRREA